MERNFQFSEACKLIEKHENMLQALTSATENEFTLVKKCKNAVQKYINIAVRELMNDTSVTELSTYQNGLRITPLIQNGYKTMGDIYYACEEDIAAIYGIGWNTVYRIKEIANKFYEIAQKRALIVLSEDKDITPSYMIIKAAVIYKDSLVYIKHCQYLLNEKSHDINCNIKKLKTASNIFSWIFSSKKKKAESIDAYDYFHSPSLDNWYSEAETTLSSLAKIAKMNDATVLSKFISNPLLYRDIAQSVTPNKIVTDVTRRPTGNLATTDPKKIQQENQHSYIYHTFFGFGKVLSQNNVYITAEFGGEVGEKKIIVDGNYFIDINEDDYNNKKIPSTGKRDKRHKDTSNADNHVEPPLVTPPPDLENNNAENIKYYQSLLGMKYEEIIELLLSKYGKVPGDYYINEQNFTQNRKISRTSEGLFCHHIDEDKEPLLSTREFARKCSFEYQRADRLVYCNILEHLILHVKIVEKQKDPGNGTPFFTGIGGISFITQQINDYYSGYQYKQQYMLSVTNLIKNDFKSYIMILKYFLVFVNSIPAYASYRKENVCLGWDGKLKDTVFNALVK